jgi:hypothetical protein
LSQTIPCHDDYEVVPDLIGIRPFHHVDHSCDVTTGRGATSTTRREPVGWLLRMSGGTALLEGQVVSPEPEGITSAAAPPVRAASSRLAGCFACAAGGDRLEVVAAIRRAGGEQDGTREFWWLEVRNLRAFADELRRVSDLFSQVTGK